VCSWCSDLLPKETEVRDYSLVLFRCAKSVTVRLQARVRHAAVETEISSINTDLNRNAKGQSFSSSPADVFKVQISTDKASFFLFYSLACL